MSHKKVSEFVILGNVFMVLFIQQKNISDIRLIEVSAISFIILPVLNIPLNTIKFIINNAILILEDSI